MDRDYQARLDAYLAAMLQMKRMLQQGILTEEDYRKAEGMLSKKYGLSSCSIYRGMDWIYEPFRFNMSHQEVMECQTS